MATMQAWREVGDVIPITFDLGDGEKIKRRAEITSSEIDDDSGEIVFGITTLPEED